MTTSRYVTFAGRDPVERDPSVNYVTRRIHVCLFVPPPSAGRRRTIVLLSSGPLTLPASPPRSRSVAVWPAHLQFMRAPRVTFDSTLCTTATVLYGCNIPSANRENTASPPLPRPADFSSVLSFFPFSFSSIFYLVFSTRRVPRFERLFRTAIAIILNGDGNTLSFIEPSSFGEASPFCASDPEDAREMKIQLVR